MWSIHVFLFQFPAALDSIIRATPQLEHYFNRYTAFPPPKALTSVPWVREDGPELSCLRKGTLKDWIGNLRSWSPFVRFGEAEGVEKAEELMAYMERR